MKVHHRRSCGSVSMYEGDVTLSCLMEREPLNCLRVRHSLGCVHPSYGIYIYIFMYVCMHTLYAYIRKNNEALGIWTCSKCMQIINI